MVPLGKRMIEISHSTVKSEGSHISTKRKAEVLKKPQKIEYYDTKGDVKLLVYVAGWESPYIWVNSNLVRLPPGEV